MATKKHSQNAISDTTPLVLMPYAVVKDDAKLLNAFMQTLEARQRAREWAIMNGTKFPIPGVTVIAQFEPRR